MAEILKTTVNRKWLLKMVAFLVVLFGFGTWGLVDALWIYPNRGLEDASYKQRAYLEAVAQAGRLSGTDSGRTGPDEISRAAFADPAAARARLEASRDRLEEAERKGVALESAAAQSTPEGQRAAAELRELADARADYAALQWLDALSRVNALRADKTTFADGIKELETLREAWKSKTPPKPLASYDLPLQWFFTVVGYGGALYMSVLLVRVSRTVFTWDAADQRLTLPDGRQLVPADIAEFDKRKWDKFFIFLQFKDGRPELKLDLLRHSPLEDWIIAMEDAAFPDRARERAEAKAKADAEAAATAAAQTNGTPDAAPAPDKVA